ncbi:BREX system P-loop protein BrxC [Bradyrhizobium sp. Tv2a-2]|uniref:BREX system P-loop protein BrxC n=1 Tax=Bradyrhizobium sp. Tv2a-2 TaxID=113395 RepID=UPI0003FCFCE2|nr:BREX system P-loop protein BrxC [Bradyrhizobium sp. Tv2a-2]
MTVIADLLDRDPRGQRLVNNGQARLSDTSPEEDRGELRTFVCEGRYAEGITRIIESFCRDLGKSSQQAAWVSGFYGSGKSHLLKMLGYLWANELFPDGMSPRTLVEDMPESARAALRELDVEAARHGGLFAAAGPMPSGQLERPRHSVLSIVLRAAGLPGDYGKAAFCLWLEDKGIADEVKAAVASAGGQFEDEIEELYMSPVIPKAIAGQFKDESIKEIRERIRTQYKTPDIDIDRNQFVSMLKRVLARRGKSGKTPLTLILLDEVQIYIGDSQDRAGAIAEIAETLAKEFDSRVILVGAGQSALQGTSQSNPQLVRLLDRFTIRVQLDDNDVETVTRKVLLRKKADARPLIERCLDENDGAISRQLGETKIAARPSDRAIRVDDYPMLPIRRRFWDVCFRAADLQGTQSQLRSQLRILHDALAENAEKPLGAVVPADVLYEALKAALVQSGALPRDAYDRIEPLDKAYGADGALAKRLAGLAFLISRLPTEAGADIGVRATPDHLADLLVDDLTVDQGAFRSRVRVLIDRMVEDGHLVRIGEEVRIQTTEGRAWQQEFQKFRSHYGNDLSAIADSRDKLIEEGLASAVRQVSAVHGDAKVPCKVVAHRGDRAPEKDGRNVPLWVRDGWRTPAKEAREAARTLGSADGIVHLYIDKPANNDLRDAIADLLAAKATLDRRGLGHGASGEEARRGMETRERIAEERAKDLAGKLVDDAEVLLGGGTAEKQATLVARLEAAVETARKRLFPQFKDADRPAVEWEKALKTAREGGEHPFAAVGHVAEADTHPVGRAVLGLIGPGKSGRDVRQQFEREPYGWPKDAIDAALVALVRANKLTVILNGEPASATALDGTAIGKATFRREEISISAREKIGLAGLLQRLVGPISNRDDLAEPAREFLRKLRALGESAGGERPLPAAPRLAFEDEAQALAGNALLRLLLDRKSEIEQAIESWKERAKLKAERIARWRTAERLARHAEPLTEATTDLIELKGIRDGRQLLESNNPLPPPMRRLRELLTKQLVAAHKDLSEAVRSALDALNANPVWATLDLARKEAILAEVGLKLPQPPDTSDDEVLADSLDRRPLGQWQAEIRGVADLQVSAAQKAAQVSAPQTQRAAIERGTIVSSEPEVDVWLARQRAMLVAAVKRGPVVIS